MTVYYARPNLTTWADPTGWSTTSGGASAGAYPGSTNDTAIFDSTSGLARTISIPSAVAIASMVISPSNRLIFSGAGSFSLNQILSPNQSWQVYNCDIYVPIFVYAANGTVGYSMTHYASGSNIYGDVTLMPGMHSLGTDMNLAGALIIQGNAGVGNSFFDDKGYNVTFGTLRFIGATNNAVVNQYTTTAGKWTSTSGTFDCQYCSRFNVPPSGIYVNGPSGTLTLVGATTFPYVEINMSAGAQLTVNTPPNCVITTLKIGPGATLNLMSTPLVATTILADGSGNLIQLYNPSTTVPVEIRATSSLLNWCKFTRCFSNTTLRATSSVDGGGNSGITFVPVAPVPLFFFM